MLGQGAAHELQPVVASGALPRQAAQAPLQVSPRTELALVLGDDGEIVHRISFYGAAPQTEIETQVRRKVESVLGPKAGAAFSLQDDYGADVVLSHTLPDGLRLRVVPREPASDAAAAAGFKRKRDAVDSTPATTPPVEPRVGVLGGGGAAARSLGEPSRARPMLPEPSVEQKAVIDAVVEGKCTAVTSVAGSGKTTLMLQIARALPVGRHARIVTYNRALKDECEKRIAQLRITDRIRCHTVHGLVTRCSGRLCKNDTDLLDFIKDCQSNIGPDGTAQVLESRKLPSADLFMLDECQDLRPSLYRALGYILKAAMTRGPQACDALQMVLVGDPKQLLYDFYSGDEATAKYLEDPSTHFGHLTGRREWQHLRLSVSYRLTPHVATVVNAIWDTDIVGGNTDDDNRQVEYLCRNPFPPNEPVGKENAGDDKHVTTSFLASVLDEHGPENVMFLAQSVKSENSPIMRHVNRLGEMYESRSTPRNEMFDVPSNKDDHSQDEPADEPETEPRRLYNFDVKENRRGFEGQRELTNKCRVWTFCSAKGCEADCVVVFGVDCRDVNWLSPLNQTGVGLSRARKRLIIIHGREWSKSRREYVAGLYYPRGGAVGLDPLADDFKLQIRQRSSETKRLLEAEQNRAILTRNADDLPAHTALKTDDNDDKIQAVDVVYQATDFTYMSAVAETYFLRSYGSFTKMTIRDGSLQEWTDKTDVLPARIEYQIMPRFDQTKEDVSAIYGMALPLWLQWEQHGFCPVIEAIVSEAVLVISPNIHYSYLGFEKILEQCCCDALAPDIQEMCKRRFNQSSTGGKLQGRDLIKLVNEALQIRKTVKASNGELVQVSVRAVDNATFDKDIGPYIEQLKKVYAKPAKAPFEWLYIANVAMAFQAFHEKLKQVGTDVAGYETWVDAPACAQGLDRLRQVVPPTGEYQSKFEHQMLFRFGDGIGTPGKPSVVVGVGGTVDWMGVETGGDSPFVIELKFVAELDNTHKLQTLVYVALFALETEEDAKGLLFNARTGELWRVQISCKEAERFLLDIAQAKHSGVLPPASADACSEAVTQKIPLGSQDQDL